MSEYRFNEDQTEVTAFGKTYVAVDVESVESDECDECAFYSDSIKTKRCPHHCMECTRPDGREIIWKIKKGGEQ